LWADPDSLFQVLLLSSDLGAYRVWYEEQVNGMFLKQRHFGPGIPPQAGERPKSATNGAMDGLFTIPSMLLFSPICR
jgi:hypothetical protein